MPLLIPIQLPPVIAAATAMDMEQQSPLICPPVSRNFPPPPTPHEISIVAAAEIQASADSEILDSVNLSGGHTKIDIASTLEELVTPPKKRRGNKPTEQSDTRSLVAYYKDCTKEEGPMPCDEDLLLCICNELEELGSGEFHVSRVR